MDNTALIVDGTGCAIFHGLSHVVNVDIITEHFPCIAVFGGHRRARKANKGRIGKGIADDSRVADYDSGFGFTRFIFTHNHALIHAVLAAMGFVCHNHDVAAIRQRFLAFLELEHGGENDAVGGSAFQQLLQMRLTFSLHRRLTQECCALGKLSIQLIVQVDSVCHDHDGRAVQRFLQ